MTGLAISSTTERPRAPGSLRLVQALVNTFDIDAGRDAIADAEGLTAWLEAEHLPRPRTVSPVDVVRTRDLREALRETLEANAHLPSRAIQGDPGERLSRAAAPIPMRVASSPLGPVLEPAGAGIDAALGMILAAAVGAVADGSWSRLKVCRNDACRWAYWDTSRNRSGVWCTMTVCGNRAKGRAFRQRAAGAAG